MKKAVIIDTMNSVDLEIMLKNGGKIWDWYEGFLSDYMELFP